MNDESLDYENPNNKNFNYIFDSLNKPNGFNEIIMEHP